MQTWILKYQWEKWYFNSGDWFLIQIMNAGKEAAVPSNSIKSIYDFLSGWISKTKIEQHKIRKEMRLLINIYLQRASLIPDSS